MKGDKGLSHNSQELKKNKMEKNKMKKLVFLTMVFGLMMVFTGSISAQERPGKLEPNCAGKSPRVGDLVWVYPKTGKAMIARRNKPSLPWYALCDLSINIDSAFRKRNVEEYYAAKITVANYFGTSYVLRKDDIVSWLPVSNGDLYIFKTADGKEVGKIATALSIPNPKR